VQQKLWFSARDLATRFDKSQDAIERMLRNGDILGIKVGGSWRVHVEALAEFEERGIPSHRRARGRLKGAVLPDRMAGVLQRRAERRARPARAERR
jgi:hypothetical protein